MRPYRWRAAAGAWAVPTMLIGAITACNPVFEPFEDRDREFSIFGFFDASADTQWVRVMPIRQSILASPEPSDAAVTLEDLDNGAVIELENRVVGFDGSSFLEDGEDLYVQNFRTTEPIVPGTTYRFTALRPDGGSATADLPIPEDYLVTVTYSGLRATVRVTGIDHPGPVYIRYHYPPDCENFSGPPPFFTVSTFFDTHAVGDRAFETTLLPGGAAPCAVLRTEIVVVASGGPWPSGVEFSTSALAVPDLPLFVGDAVGFLAGINTRAMLWSPCVLQPPERPCELVYDGNGATATGMVVDDTCGGPVQGAVVRLTEALEDPGAPARVRQAVTSVDGQYEFDALEPGVRHRVVVTHPARWPPGDPFTNVLVYGTYESEFDPFEPGERATIEVIELPRRVPC